MAELPSGEPMRVQVDALEAAFIRACRVSVAPNRDIRGDSESPNGRGEISPPR